jgi:hypothetical protein
MALVDVAVDPTTESPDMAFNNGQTVNGAAVVDSSLPNVPGPESSWTVTEWGKLDYLNPTDMTTDNTSLADPDYGDPLYTWQAADGLTSLGVSYNGSDNVQLSAVSATDPLVATGSGDDLLTGSATGTSVLDAGTATNIETDGGNANTTFVQNGYVAGNTWDFLQNFHGSDEDIMFGYIPGLSKISVQAIGGLASDTGATVTIHPGNGDTEEVTFVGVSASQIHGCGADVDGVPSWVLWT